MKWQEDTTAIENKKQTSQPIIHYNNYLSDSRILQSFIHEFDHFPIDGYCNEGIANSDYLKEIPMHNMDAYTKNQQGGTFQVDMTELTDPNLWNYETRYENKLSNNLYPKNIIYNYSGGDVCRLVILKKQVFSIKQHSLEEQSQISEYLTTSIFMMDIQKVRNNFYTESRMNQNLYKIKQNLCNRKVKRKNRKDNCIPCRRDKEKPFDILIQEQCMGHRASTYRHSISNLVELLSKIGTCFRNLTPISKCACVSSSCIGNWYFLNVSQAYLLRIILRHVNVNALHVMRNVYFLLVTAKNPNVNVELKFVMTHSVFAVLDDIFPIVFSSKSFEWSIDHNKVLKSTSIAVFYFSNTYHGPRTMAPLKAIEYTKPFSDCAINVTVDQSSQSENRNSFRIMSYTDTGSNALFSNSPNDSGISLSMSVNNIAVQTNPQELHLCDSKESNTVFMYCACDFPLMKKILWLIHLQRCKTLNASNNLSNMFGDDVINETMFETTSVVGYDKYLKQWFTLSANFFLKFKSLLKVLFNRN